MFWKPAPSPQDITARLAEKIDPSSLERARASAERRTIESVFGTGEAELVALMVGLKPLVRQLLSQTDLDALRARGVPRELTLEVAPKLRGGRNVVFLSRDPARAKAGVKAEEARNADEELGALLGYPRCCIEAFNALPEDSFRKRTNIGLMAAAARRSTAWVPRLNGLDLGIFHYLPWWPCTFACATSKTYADDVASALAQRHGGWLSDRKDCAPGCRHQRFVNAVDEVLSAHRLVVLEEVQVSLRGRFEGNELQVTEAWPTFRDRSSGATLEPAQREAAIHLAAAITRAGRVELKDDELLLGGKAALKCPGALLARFGSS